MTNCLNFGSPEDPAVMWQLAEAVRGLADGCKTLGIPVTGGNVSLYNQTGRTAIHPTPVIGVLGVHDDVRKRLAAGFAADGARIVLLGSTTRRVRRVGVGAGRPPAPGRAAAGRRPDGRTATWPSRHRRRGPAGVLASAHDLSEGGLAIALAESCLRGGARLPDKPRGVVTRIPERLRGEAA